MSIFTINSSFLSLLLLVFFFTSLIKCDRFSPEMKHFRTETEGELKRLTKHIFEGHFVPKLNSTCMHSDYSDYRTCNDPHLNHLVDTEEEYCRTVVLVIRRCYLAHACACLADESTLAQCQAESAQNTGTLCAPHQSISDQVGAQVDVQLIKLGHSLGLEEAFPQITALIFMIIAIVLFLGIFILAISCCICCCCRKTKHEPPMLKANENGSWVDADKVVVEVEEEKV